VRYGVLGPLEVFVADRDRTPTAPRLRTLLALLLIRANQVVATDELMTELWGDRLPASAANSLQVFVARLRGLLAPAVAPRAPGQVLLTCPSGYRLQVGACQLDLHTFDSLAEEGELALAGGDPARATRLLREALALWRGPLFAGVPTGSGLQLHALRIEECRLRVLEQRLEADLRLGRHAELVPELETLVAAHPLREGVHGKLIVALYRAGRRAESIAAYRRLRARLADELAVEPSAAVRRLYRAVITADPAIAAPRPSIVVRREAGPAQLPPDIADFTGREEAVAALEAPLLAGPGTDRTAVPVVSVAGPAGVGKTALAVHCAQRLRGRYPDGQLYLDLCGTGPKPLQPRAALGHLLRGLGVDPAAIPESVAERSSLLRSRTAGRRILVLLDDATDESRVRPLLPGSHGCGVVVTSRRRLPGLAGAVPLDLGRFTGAEAVRLLERLTGPARVLADPAAARAIARLCDHLPLAVRAAGARLAARPDWSLARLAQRLADGRSRLDELTAGDLDVRAGVGASYRALRPAARRGLRLLGLLPGGEFAAWTAAALLGTGTAAAEALVDSLVDAQLLQLTGRDPVRYRCPDLVRLFAAERLYADEPPEVRRAARRRLLAARATHPADLQGGLPVTAGHPGPVQ
jgi:DNA-binding SARP family transcriptional activator